MAIAHIPKQQTTEPFVFSSLDRASKAVKRLKAFLEPQGKGEHPLGWYKKVLARVVGFSSWDELRRTVEAKGEPSRLDHDMKDFGAMERRRHEQAAILAGEAGIGYHSAARIIAEVEPTGNGTGPFRLFEVDEAITLRYVLPPLPSSPDGRLRIKGDETGWEPDTPYGSVHLLYDLIRDRAGDDFADAMTLEHIGHDGWRIGIGEPWPEASVSLHRVVWAKLYDDEPRPLRPTEIERAHLEWEVESCNFPKGKLRDEIVEAFGTAIAALMIRDMVWALIAPRPPVMEQFFNSLDINEDDEDQVELAQVAKGQHGYALDSDAEGAAMEDDDTITGYGVPSFRIARQCQDINDLEVTDS